MKNRIISQMVAACVLLTIGGQAGATDTSFVRPGDRWVCFGDSITAAGTYPRILERTFKHYHPDVEFTVINSGQSGDTATTDEQKFADRILQYRPTVVSVMFGMNEAINIWSKGQPREPVQAGYRAGLSSIARLCKAHGIAVIFMTPTLTDEGCRWALYPLADTVSFLRECNAIMRDVAAKEGIPVVPVQEEFEALQNRLNPAQILRTDGVHPSAPGQYQIARSLWEHCRFDAPLGTGARRIGPAPKPVPPGVSVNNRFLDPAAAQLGLTLTTAKPQPVTLTWSLGTQRKSERLTLTGTNAWTLPLPPELLMQKNGQSGELLLDLASGEKRSLYIVDLARTGVVHPVEGAFTGTVESAMDRPEGKRVATWSFRLLGKALLFEGEVFDSEINSEAYWPFGRDGFNLMLDFRPNDRFADIGLDSDVHQTILLARKEPFFAVSLRPWLGYGMGSAAVAGGELTATGYKARLYIYDKWTAHALVDFSDHDFIGVDMCVVDADHGGLVYHHTQTNERPMDQYANNLLILDLKNRLKGDQVITVNLFSGR